ncbi:TetR family transcriptional regulator [Sediminihabitans luteus]|uniref:TetR family transcriptional regulator n=1 Tax=Sediminihabitans luteus TaxID=1138585 RepID=A0A2M9CEJ6_9CELL|nr:TetR/AcrR family transcriptional regulator [Sediminihabitans luteus]PJJ70275.1 TetR family transcriptional regulator [Sediminihabitans luteus]GII97746.1 hypothetical protein Slu03_01240 [Sediminihabitans luteus]
MTPPTRRAARREPEDRRRELLEAAVAQADDAGLADLAPADVAARAGRSKALVFHYFDSTTGLRRDVAAVAVAELDAALVAPPTLPAAARPGYLAHAFVSAVLARRRIWQDVWLGALATDPPTREALDVVRDALVDRMALTAVTIGVDPSPRLRTLARGWVALVENITASWLADDRVLDRDALEEMIVASLAVLAPELPEPTRTALTTITGAAGTR